MEPNVYMPQPSAPAPMMPPAAPAKKSHKGFWWTLAIIILVAVAWWYFDRQGTMIYQTPTPSASASPVTEGINGDLQAIQDVNVDAELKTIDADINQL